MANINLVPEMIPLCPVPEPLDTVHYYEKLSEVLKADTRKTYYPGSILFPGRQTDFEV